LKLLPTICFAQEADMVYWVPLGDMSGLSFRPESSEGAMDSDAPSDKTRVVIQLPPTMEKVQRAGQGRYTSRQAEEVEPDQIVVASNLDYTAALLEAARRNGLL
jgi:hypothetical protein